MLARRQGGGGGIKCVEIYNRMFGNVLLYISAEPCLYSGRGDCFVDNFVFRKQGASRATIKGVTP